MASKQSLVRTAQSLLSRWPADPLRPTAQLGPILTARLAQNPPKFPGPDSTPQAAAEQVRAVAALVDDAFSKQYAFRAERSATGGGLMKPRSNPGYYEALIRDLDEVPTRTFLERVKMRVGGMFRWM